MTQHFHESIPLVLLMCRRIDDPEFQTDGCLCTNLCKRGRKDVDALAPCSTSGIFKDSSIFSQQFAHKQRFGCVVTASLMLRPSISRIVQSFSVILQEKPKTDGVRRVVIIQLWNNPSSCSASKTDAANMEQKTFQTRK